MTPAPSPVPTPAPTTEGDLFSALGALGAFAATSERVFGGLVQRTMAKPLRSRYHYGHPDMLDKLALMAQGGISKATTGLILRLTTYAWRLTPGD